MSGFYQLLNSTSFTFLHTGSITSNQIKNGDFANSTNFVIAAANGWILMVDNSWNINWQ